MHPVKVYLDTSDYSRFADIGRDGRQTKLEPILAEIISFADDGIADFRFSAIHMAEILKFTQETKEVAVRKAKLIERLCGNKCLTFISEIWKNEWICARSAKGAGKTQGPIYAYSESGKWYPDVSGITDGLRHSVISGIKKKIQEDSKLTRPERRAILSKIIKNGQLTELAETMLADSLESIIKELRQDYPLTERFYCERMLERFIMRKLNGTVVAEELMVGIARPTHFIGWYFEKYHEAKQLPTWLLDLGDKLYSSISEMREEMPEVPQDMKRRLKGHITPLFLREKISSAYNAQSTNLRHRAAPPHSVDALPKGAFPSIDLVSESLHAYIVRHALTPQKHLRSDGGDFAHLGHAPYVDIFRADANFSSLVAKPLAAIGVRVAPRLQELPNIIKEEFAKLN